MEDKLSIEEAEFLDVWEQYYDQYEESYRGLSQDELDQIKLKMWASIQSNQKAEAHKTPVLRKLLYKFKYAAVLVIAFGLALIIYKLASQDKVIETELLVELNHLEEPFHEDMSPGTNQAILRLDDQRVLSLSSDQEEIVMRNGIAYSDGSLVGNINLENVVKLTLETPRGGTYRLTLPDGTKVWLNASTKLRYPERFANDHRSVELDGEAFFEVVPGKIPFYVKTKEQRIEVLGTSFNISAYEEDGETLTTLVNGSVKVSHLDLEMDLLLNPGQQAVLNNDKMLKKEVEVSDYIAWKNGLFVFNDTPLSLIVKQLQRWYNFDSVQGDIPDLHFNGGISRNVRLSEVLEMLEATSSMVDFEIINKELIVKSKK